MITLAELLSLPGASALQEAWLAAMAGQHGYLTDKDAEVAACDAIIDPVVTGHPDLAIVDAMIDVVLGFLDGANCEDPTPTDGGAARRSERQRASTGRGSGEPRGGPGGTERPSLAQPDGTAGTGAGAGGSKGGEAPLRKQSLLSPEAWQALRYTMARLASSWSPGRTGSPPRPARASSTPRTAASPFLLDIGYSASIPGAIRRAVQLRARHCEWPGCDKPPAWCDLHHLRHQADGGETSLSNCILLCQFHQDVCIHRWGWRLVLHPDGTTTAYGPKGQVLHSHGPPQDHGPPGTKAA